MQADLPPATRSRASSLGIYRAFETKDVALLREAVTPDWAYLPEPPGQKPGPDQMVSIFADLAVALPDMHIERDSGHARAEQSCRLREGERHAGRAAHGYRRDEETGALRDPLVSRIARDGRIAKTWHLEDWLSVFRQLGEERRAFSGASGA